ncbi:hypothetical protein PUN28_009013 [Cardiocondyla obscurior]|uniref:Uncharacterized protein n=1 Tax=Cardiocondyla obscurior TaxID=286306 RepID=A0AAW2FTC3_9HYME
MQYLFCFYHCNQLSVKVADDEETKRQMSITSYSTLHGQNTSHNNDTDCYQRPRPSLVFVHACERDARDGARGAISFRPYCACAVIDKRTKRTTEQLQNIRALVKYNYVRDLKKNIKLSVEHKILTKAERP